MNSVGAIFGTVIFGVMSALMGSKRAMTLTAYPIIVFWLFIYFGNDFLFILLARFATGLTTGGFQSGVVLYVSEISNDKQVFSRIAYIVYLYFKKVNLLQCSW